MIALKQLPKLINNIEVLEDLGMNNQNPKKRIAIFKCECGNKFVAKVNAVKVGHKRSCGCLKHKPSVFTHLKTKHPLYRKWSGMLTRTLNKREMCYRRYGGRGIKVCDEWRNDFMNFYDWAIENGWKEGLTIDRINNDGDYEPNNCQWLTMKENTMKDRRSTYVKQNLVDKIITRYTTEHITITKLAEEYKTYKKVISSILKENNIKIENRRLKNGI